MLIHVKAALYRREVNFSLNVNPFVETVYHIKQKIEAKIGLPAENQHLFCKSVIQNNSDLVFDSIIKEGSHVVMESIRQVVPSFKLIVANVNGDIVRLVAKSTYTISDVKELVQYIEYIPTRKQCLMYDGCVLEDSKTLADLNIYDEAEIQLKVL